jgi:hypothetical protein
MPNMTELHPMSIFITIACPNVFSVGASFKVTWEGSVFLSRDGQAYANGTWYFSYQGFPQIQRDRSIKPISNI